MVLHLAAIAGMPSHGPDLNEPAPHTKGSWDQTKQLLSLHLHGWDFFFFLIHASLP